jgi:hypothetical protein
MIKLRGKFGDRKAGTSIAQSELSERDSATTGLEESDMSDPEVQGELNQRGSETIGVQNDRGALRGIGEGEIRVIGSGEVMGRRTVTSGRDCGAERHQGRSSM